MPAVRLSRRRRSSPTLSFTHVKPGVYSIPRPVTFAPNVTPVSYVAPEDTSASTTPEPGSPTVTLFPPSECIEPPRSRRRVPAHKRRSLGYIPRPPNAFMLFRADFVRQKHVPGTIETNHGSLSKIIGNCWRSLPLDEKRVWEIKAKHEKAAHKARYPEYRFRPVHNKNKNKDKKDKQPTTVDDERRCEEVAQLLLEGKKGDELAAAVRDLDQRRAEGSESASPAPPFFSDPSSHFLPMGQGYTLHRRSSSVPLPNDYYPYPPQHNQHQHQQLQHFGLGAHAIALPSVPSFQMSRSASRPASPQHQHQQRMMLGLGQRRASSAQPYMHHRSWTMPMPMSTSTSMSMLQRDDSPLPDFDKSLFNQDFFENTPFGGGHTQSSQQMDFNDLMGQQSALGPLDAIPPHEQQHLNLNLGNLDFNIDPALQGPSTSTSTSSHDLDLDMDPLSWMSMSSLEPPLSNPPSNPHSSSSSTHSHPSTAHSSPIPDSPAPLLHAPQPQSANTQTVFTDLWKQFTGGQSFDMGSMGAGAGEGLGLEFMSHDAEMGMCGQQQHHQHQGFAPPGPDLESLFEPQMFQTAY